MNHRPQLLLASMALFVLTAAHAQECEPTLLNIEGPFYRQGSPERTDLFNEVDGPRLTIVGQVVGYDCRPIAGAWIDFWQTDGFGAYDNASAEYRFRGHQFTDENGEWILVTNIPGIYPSRPKHIHVKVEGEIADTLTTQLYFPNDPENDMDNWYDRELEIEVIEELPDGEILAIYRFQLEEPGTTICQADFNDDGLIDGADLTTLLGDWGSKDSDADLTGDNLVDGADLAELLGYWGPCS